MPAKVAEIELARGIESIYGLEGYDRVLALVRFCGQPVGWIKVEIGESMVTAAQIESALRDQIGLNLLQSVLGGELAASRASCAPLLPVSVIVCALDPGPPLDRCLQALSAIDYPDYEVIVVGSASKQQDSRLSEACPAARFVYEEQLGLNRARNRGIQEASYEIVAFVGSRACADRNWLQAMVQPFADPDVMAVTGLAVPAELDTSAQVFLENGYGLGRGLKRQTLRREVLTPGQLLEAGALGVGVNMAFRRSLFGAIGLFDVTLDIGTFGGDSGDIDMLHRILTGGHMLVYEPAALVRHVHWPDMASLRQWVYDSSQAFGAYLISCARRRSVGWGAMGRYVLRGWLGRRILRRLWRPGCFPRHLIVLELLGGLTSPLAAWQRRLRDRRSAATPRTLEAERPDELETPLSCRTGGGSDAIAHRR